MVFKRKEQIFDIAISGGGVVGSTMAGLLGLQGFQVCLICGESKPKWSRDYYHPRVNAVNHASIRIFKYLGIWEDIRKKRVNPYYQMKVWESDTDGSIQFTAHELRVPHLGTIIENTVLTSSLFEFLRQQSNISLIEKSQLEDISYKNEYLHLRTHSGHEVSCRLLVGADGANSISRSLSHIGKKQYISGQHAIVSEVLTENQDGHTAWQVFLPTGVAALLPLDKGKFSLVWSCNDLDFRTLLAQNDAAFCESLNTIFKGRVGTILSTGKRSSFALMQHQAESYIADRVVLIGDSAHAIHPLAGLGANMGLLDAACLSQILGESKQNGRDIDSYTVLRRYERWRKGENGLVLNAMRGFKFLFGSSIQGSRMIGGAGFKIVDRLQPVKKTLAGFAMGNIGDLPYICSASKNADI
ncbi:MAG: FAD-dependent monooxygenase [Gammaproteobacteria bacterium]|nr:FAD-dependent monooxygenase [Gammaproteobacteria bacterium]MCY4275420.1 FAD-dependent monooxygenase [Gammaproteobacteria bacterium]